jgi:DNA-binding transcriptional LysR family regulator
MGAALMPTMLVEAELARGELVVPCDRPLHGGRSYHLVVPERRAGNPALARFADWLIQAAAG